MFTHSTMPIINERSVNSTMTFNDFHLSYNASSQDYGCDTTAFVLRQRVFIVINGDHRKALSRLATEKGVDGCVDYIIDNITLLNDKSEHKMALGIGQDPFNLQPDTFEVLGDSNIDRFLNAVQSQECV